jgi:hypothetical protein
MNNPSPEKEIAICLDEITTWERLERYSVVEKKFVIIVMWI